MSFFVFFVNRSVQCTRTALYNLHAVVWLYNHDYDGYFKMNVFLLILDLPHHSRQSSLRFIKQSRIHIHYFFNYSIQFHKQFYENENF